MNNGVTGIMYHGIFIPLKDTTSNDVSGEYDINADLDTINNALASVVGGQRAMINVTDIVDINEDLDYCNYALSKIIGE